MARCSTCKQEKWPLHKRKGFVVCESCLGGGFIEWHPLNLFSWIGTEVRRLGTRIKNWFQHRKDVDLHDKSKFQNVPKPGTEFAAKRVPSKLVRIGGGYRKV